MTSKKTNGSNAPEAVAPAQTTLKAQINEFELKRKKFDELSRKMRHLQKITTDLEFLETSKVQGTENAEGSEPSDQVSKIVLNFSGSSRYDDKSYTVENPTIMQEILHHLLKRYAQKRAELEESILQTSL